MTPWYEYVGMSFVYLVIAFMALFILWLLYGKRFEHSCYEAKHKDNRDDDQDYRKPSRCDTCTHSEISTAYPMLACPIQGKHVDPYDRCKEWQ